MFQQPTTKPTPPTGEPGRPWSPLVVGFITLLLPAGGVVLAIRDMQRLGALEHNSARRLIWTAIGVLSAGYALFVFTAPRHSNGVPQLDSNTTGFITVALCMVAYFAVRRPFATWRTRSSAHTDNMLPAVGTALMYQAIVVLAVVVVVLLFGPLAGINTLQMHA